MPSFTLSETFDAPRDKLWALFADYGNVADFHPGIESSCTLNDESGLGGLRNCEFGKGQGVTEEITTFEEGKAIAFTATEFRKMPMRELVGTFTFEGDQPTKVTVEMKYRMKGGFVMDLMARPMMKKASMGMMDGARGLVR